MKSKMESMQADYAILKFQIQEDQEVSNKAYKQTDDNINKARGNVNNCVAIYLSICPD